VNIEEQYGSRIAYILADWNKYMNFLEDGRCVIVDADSGDHTVIEAEDKP
jgi:hypothetical protein